MTVADRYSLREAAATFFRGGQVTARTLARYVRLGKLEAESIGGQYFVTEAAVATMLAASKVQPKPSQQKASPPWPDPENRPGCGSVPPVPPAPALPPAPPSGSSLTERAKLARTQAQMTLAALKTPSPPTSRRSTNRRQAQIVPISSSSTRS